MVEVSAALDVSAGSTTTAELVVGTGSTITSVEDAGSGSTVTQETSQSSSFQSGYSLQGLSPGRLKGTAATLAMKAAATIA